jgi:hypothetical protein
MRTPILLLAVLSIAALAAAGCGKDEAPSSASSLAPATSVIYGEVTLKPEGDQKEAVESIVSKFPGQGSAGDRLQALVDKALKESSGPGLSYKTDIEPWLGDEAAFFVTGKNMNDNALLIAAEDEGKALEAIEKTAEGKITRKSYRDVDYFMDEADDTNTATVFDGFVVAGTEAGVKAAIDTSKDGSPLADSDAYDFATEDVSDDRLGLLFVNSPQLLKNNTNAAATVPDNFKRVFETPTVVTVDADEDGVAFEGSVPQGSANVLPFLGQGSELIEDLPADSWLAMAQPDFDKTLDFFIGSAAGFAGGREVIERQFKAATGLDLQRDVLDWMGDFAVFVRGSGENNVNGALIIETSDEAASGRLIERLRKLAETQADNPGDRVVPLSAPGGGEGFTLVSPSIPRPLHLFQRGGRVVLAFGDEAAAEGVEASQPLGESADFTQAAESLGDYDVSFYVAVQPILDLVESTAAASDADWQKAKPYLEPLDALVGGTSGESGGLKSAFKLIVK